MAMALPPPAGKFPVAAVQGDEELVAYPVRLPAALFDALGRAAAAGPTVAVSDSGAELVLTHAGTPYRFVVEPAPGPVALFAQRAGRLVPEGLLPSARVQGGLAAAGIRSLPPHVTARS